MEIKTSTTQSKMKKEEKLIDEIRALIGETVSTVWGPSTVEKVVKETDGTWYVHMLEFGTELYTIELSKWKASLM